LGRHLHERYGDAVFVEAWDLNSLSPEDREPVLDAVCKGAEFPMVLVDGRVACAGDIETDSVMEAVDLVVGQLRC
jgi:hypothetical protein